MVWKREIASWKEGLTDKGKEGKGRTDVVSFDKAGVANLWLARPSKWKRLNRI
jgi:hypothetical protein